MSDTPLKLKLDEVIDDFVVPLANHYLALEAEQGDCENCKNLSEFSDLPQLALKAYKWLLAQDETFKRESKG